MLRIGITGQNGFIGSHLYRTLGLFEKKYERVEFDKSFFENGALLDRFVQQSDVIVHLAGLNRHDDSQVIYNTNINLAKKLVSSLIRTKSTAHVIFSSSSQEDKDNIYGSSKREARIILQNWANQQQGTLFSGMIIPNVFGPFCKPFYNSVIATFCHQLIQNNEPHINLDAKLNLIYIDELVQQILTLIDGKIGCAELQIPTSSVYKVSDILNLLRSFKDQYLQSGIIPLFSSNFELNLFNTFRSYLDLKSHFPVLYRQHLDERGAFTELIRLRAGGQVSFSTTVSGVTRGNHFHTRKIERFSVIKGKARIQLRKLGTSEVMDFFLDGNCPAFIDIPIWYAHNITNIGGEELYTIFWINELYNLSDSDTFSEKV